jgi:purine-binding chemotaxis protein CheW
MAQLGHSAPEATETEGTTSVVFRAGSLLCALRLDDVIETMRPLATRPLAGAPAFVRGICIMRGVPTPVVDVARLLGGDQAEINRFLAVRTERGPVAFGTGDIIGIRATAAGGRAAEGHAGLLTGASSRLVAGVSSIDAEPLLLLQSMRVVPEHVWAAAAGEAAG